MKLTINNVEVDDQGIRALFAQLQARLEDMTPVFREIGEIILESIQSNIRAGESPDGVSWPQSIRAKAEGGATLMDTRTHLYNSLNVQAEKNEVTVGRTGNTRTCINWGRSSGRRTRRRFGSSSLTGAWSSPGRRSSRRGLSWASRKRTGKRSRMRSRTTSWRQSGEGRDFDSKGLFPVTPNNPLSRGEIVELAIWSDMDKHERRMRDGQVSEA